MKQLKSGVWGTRELMIKLSSGAWNDTMSKFTKHFLSPEFAHSLKFSQKLKTPATLTQDRIVLQCAWKVFISSMGSQGRLSMCYQWLPPYSFTGLLGTPEIVAKRLQWLHKSFVALTNFEKFAEKNATSRNQLLRLSFPQQAWTREVFSCLHAEGFKKVQTDLRSDLVDYAL